jgi:hypothetical protein
VRAGVAILLVAAALLAFVVVRLIGFAGAGEQAERGEGVPELATPDFCGRYEATRLPSGFTLRRRDTRNLGEGTIGRSSVYSDGLRGLEVHIGYDALDEYEDLDFTEQEVVVDGQSRTLHVPGALGSGGFLAVSWDEERESARCKTLTVIGRRLSEAELLDVVAGVRRSSG